MRQNKLRTLLSRNESSVGTHIHSTWPAIIEIIGATRLFDYVEFTAEYAPYTLYDFENMARAAELFGMSLMIKVDRSLQTYLAQRALGAGIQNVLFTDSRTPEDVCESVRSVRAETPQTKGTMGCAMRRDVGYVSECGSEAYVEALEQAVVAVMIEKQSLVDSLEEVLETRGIDMVQFGPCDYAMSIGIPGKRHDPRVRSAERKMLTMALERGIAPRVEVDSIDDAKPYLDMGVRHFCLGSELSILRNWLAENGSELRELLAC